MSHRHPRPAAALALLLLLACAAAGHGSPTDQSNRALRPVPRVLRGLPGTVRLDLASGVPVVLAEVEGQQLRLIIDTGASWSVLTPAAAQRIGLETHEPEELKAQDAAGEARAVKAAHVTRLTLPSLGEQPVMLEDFDVVVMESAIAEDAGVDGMLGLPVLRRTVVKFDFAKEELDLGVDPLPAADDRQILSLRPTSGGLVGVDVRFDAPAGGEGRRVPPTLLIDTGFSGLIHLPREAAAVLADAGATTRAGTSATAHRQRALERVTLGSDLLLGRHRVERPSASVFAGEDGGRSGAIGTELLRRFVVTLDVPRRRIRLEEPQQEAVPGP